MGLKSMLGPRGGDGVVLKFGVLALRLVQMVLALAVVGLYAQDLNKARKEHKYSDSKWVFATVVGSLSAVSALVYAVLTWFLSVGTQALSFAWDGLLFVLWCALFGVFGSLYIHENPEMDSGIARMKAAVWVDLVNMLLWLITAAFGAAFFFLGRRGRNIGSGKY